MLENYGQIIICDPAADPATPSKWGHSLVEANFTEQKKDSIRNLYSAQRHESDIDVQLRNAALRNKCMEPEVATYPEFILCAPLQALYSTGQVFSSVLWMKVCSL